MRLLVVGTGLVGASVGLALRDAAEVLLHDASPAALEVAVRRGAGAAWDGSAVDHVLLAVPPSAVVPTLLGLDVEATASHVASVQLPVQAAAAAAGLGARLCGTHPMAGKETSGPEAASADLFAGRPWVLCPADETSADAVVAARTVAELCGAVPVELDAAAHDAAAARVSHLPQLTASALAAVLADADLSLAGPGLQDTSRLAGSPAELWTELLTANAGAVAPLARALAAELSRAADALEAVDAAAVGDLLERGRRGRSLVPVKRGVTDLGFAVVAVQLPDEPGQLAGVLVAAAQAGVNVEDVRVEHLPGRPTGVLELLVAADGEQAARAALAAAGWSVL